MSTVELNPVIAIGADGVWFKHEDDNFITEKENSSDTDDENEPIPITEKSNDEKNAKYNRKKSNNRITKTLIYTLIEIFVFILMAAISVMVMFIIIILLSDVTVASIAGWTVIIFITLQCIVFGLFMICKRHRLEIKKWARIRGFISIFELLILFFVMEVLLSTFVPNLSIFPDAFSYDVLSDGDYIDIYQDYLNISQIFFDCNLDVSQVQIRDVTASSMVNNYFESVNFKAAAYVVIDTVHIVSSDHVISDASFIHEMVHIWQFNQGYFYEMDGLNTYFNDIISGPDISNYDYGDLDKAWNDNKDFLDFGVEQQAEIIEDYYYYLSNDIWWIYNSSFEQYAEQYVLEPCLQ